jgi:hypothetical protein
MLRIQSGTWSNHKVFISSLAFITSYTNSITYSRETLHPILQSRVGPDQFVSRIMRLREDPRFRSVGPNVLEMLDDEVLDDLTEDDGIWFDYTFVEFLKTNYGRDF